MEYNAAAYLRLSRDDERDGESMSIENQRLILTNYIQEHGWNLVDAYVDDGYTGLNFNRPSFQRMIGDVKSGKVNLVVVKDLSRFGRNYIQMGEYTDYLFPSVGCRFIALNDGVDTHTGNNDIMPFKNLFNEFYSRDISKKVKSAKVARAKTGHAMGACAPFGYIRTKDADTPYAIDETAASIVRWIFDQRCAGNGYRTIASKLNEDKVMTPRDYYYKLRGEPNPRNEAHTWPDKTVKDILANEAYIGNLVQMKTGAVSYKNHKQIKKSEDEWIRVVDTHEPIITMEQWNRVRELEKRNRTYRAKKDGTVSLFSGLLECADCHSAMKLIRDCNVRKDGTRLNHHAYICCRYSSGGAHSCTPHRIMEYVLVEAVLTDIREKAARIHYDEDAVVAEMKRKMDSNSNSETAELKRQQQAVQSRLGELERLITGSYEELVLGDIPRDVVMGMIAKYRAEQEEKTNTLAELAKKVTHSQKVEYDIREWVSLMKKCMSIEELDRELLLQLVDKIIVGQKYTAEDGEHQEITIVYNFIGI